MQFSPEKKEFLSSHKKGKPQVLSYTMPADVETPTSAMLKLNDGGYNFLLESVEGGETRGRYSILGFKPDLLWVFNNSRVTIKRISATGKIESNTDKKQVFDSLRGILKESEVEIPANLPPMSSGIFGYMGYDMVRFMEKLPNFKDDKTGIPDGIFMRPQIIVVFDSLKRQMIITTTVFPDKNKNAEKAYSEARKRIEMVINRLVKPVPNRKKNARADFYELPKYSNMKKEKYYGIVKKAKEYIKAGDIFQVVLSQRFSVPFKYDAFSFYRSLSTLNPSPFLFYINFKDFSLVGSSPEILVRLRDDVVTIRPIAGTRKRGKNKEEDKALAKDLLSDRKELAEHLMLLDLGRNDVGRVAEAGTVKVTEKMKIEYYSHVMHIVSNVEGKIRKGLDAIDALIAGFPAGTVSGAPKIRAMEIIDELEPEKRSFYAGCIGYFSGNGSMDTCIALRTALIKDDVLYIQAGGGIVADSKPEDEYQECINKAGALIKAAQNIGDY